MKREELFWLSLILLMAGLLRMGWPGLTEFKQDEARLYSLALDLAEFKSLPLHGISYSVGLPNSPLSVYLYALPLFVWKSPLAATLFVGALNTAAVALAYALARRYWGPRAAWLSALLYAAAPWAIIYSRKIWSNDLLPLFTAGYVFSGMLAFVEARRRWLLAHLGLLALVMLIHVSAAALVPVTGALLIAFRRRVDWRFIYGAAGVALLAGLAGLYVLSRTGASERSLAPLLSYPVQVTPDALWLAALVVQGTYVHSLAGPEAFRAFNATLPDFDPILWLGGVLVVLGVGYVGWRWVSQGRASPPASVEAGLIVALWLCLPILFFIPHLTPVYSHYLIVLFPAPYLLSGILLDGILARLRPVWLRLGVWLLPLSIAGSQVWLSLALLRFIGMQVTPGAFGTPLGILMKVEEAARQWGTEDILVVSQGSRPETDWVPAVFDVLLRHVPHRFVDGRTTAVFPAGKATVILWPGDYPSLDLYREWGGGNWSGVVPLRAGEGEVRFASGAGASLGVPQPREASALLSNGAELLGSGGQARRWELWWRAPQGGEGEDYQVFAHLLDAEGERVAQVDESTYATRDWRAGDLVVNYFALGGHGSAVRAGMYSYPSLAPVSVLDVQGNPAGEWIIFPLSLP